jgi:malate synthase
LQDSGHPITAPYIDALIEQISPTVKTIVPGAKEEQVHVAAEYLRAQVRKEWASEFLTTDLMPYLERVDGVK